MRARIFYDIWWFLDGEPTRDKIKDPLGDYYEFFRFDVHAHFVAYVVHMSALYEKKRSDTINLGAMTNELKGNGLISLSLATKVEMLLVQSTPIVAKIKCLRDNLFAHRSATTSYAEVFDKADLKADQLGELTEIALETINLLLVERGLDRQFFNPNPLEFLERMFCVLDDHATQNFD